VPLSVAAMACGASAGSGRGGGSVAGTLDSIGPAAGSAVEASGASTTATASLFGVLRRVVRVLVFGCSVEVSAGCAVISARSSWDSIHHRLNVRAQRGAGGPCFDGRNTQCEGGVMQRGDMRNELASRHGKSQVPGSSLDCAAEGHPRLERPQMNAVLHYSSIVVSRQTA
jgi:hypothetical protein